MDEYISKPIHVRQLLETIERAVEDAVAPKTLAEPEGMDWNEVLKVARGNRELVDTIVAAALDEMPRLLTSIREAVAAGDHTALRLAAHTLKGSVQYFGASAVFEVACRLERLGQEDDLAAAPVALNRLETELTRFTGMLARHKEIEETANLAESLEHSDKPS